MIEAIGTITGTGQKARAIVTEIKNRFDQLAMPHTTIRTAYLIWQDPYMTIGRDTFINDMLIRCGFENIFNDQLRYPTISIEEIKSRNCELLLLSSEPFPFKQKLLTNCSSNFLQQK